jgi:hypothetical protein
VSQELRAPANAATRWFGDDFDRLHPLLQALHANGGRLHGEIAIGFGRGIAGALGRRVAWRMGIPAGPMSRFEVRITHDDGAMRWERRFAAGGALVSVFRPVGRYPDGYWLEEAGAVLLKLAVDIRDGGWHWRLRGASWRGIALPAWLFPRIDAGKSIDAEGGYRFRVAFALFPLGTLLHYEGRLVAAPLSTCGASPS